MLYFRCFRKSFCSISVNITNFGDPCVTTSKYLEVYYECVPMKTLTTKDKHLPPWLLDIGVTPDPSYLRLSKVKPAINIIENEQITMSSYQRSFTVAIDKDVQVNDIDNVSLILAVAVTSVSSIIVFLIYFIIQKYYGTKIKNTNICEENLSYNETTKVSYTRSINRGLSRELYEEHMNNSVTKYPEDKQRKLIVKKHQRSLNRSLSIMNIKEEKQNSQTKLSFYEKFCHNMAEKSITLSFGESVT